MEKKRPVLSISVLVSNNRRDTIEKCMESLVPLRKAVPSELIIVDTGCTDGSVDIARKYADKVVQFTWCKDFSAARNAGLRECTGEWFLYLDDDEWFEDVSELIAFFRGVEEDYCDALWYIQRNYDNFEGTVYTDAYVGRCVKLTPETEFRGKIHEWLEPLPKLIKKVGSYVHHYGYVFKSEEDRQKHIQRNLSLEEAAVQENPEDVRMCCQLVQEYRAASMEERAEKLARETLLHTKYERTNSFVQYLLLAIPKIYAETGREEEALGEYARLEKEEVLLHQSRLAIYCERAYIYGRINQAKEAMEESLKYLKEYGVVPGENEPREFPIMDFEQYRSKFTHQKVVKVGLTGAGLATEYQRTDRLFAAVDWGYDIDLSVKYIQVLGQCYMATGEADRLIRVLKRVLKEEELLMPVCAMLHTIYEECGPGRPAFLEALESLQQRDGNFAYFHLLYTENNGITTEQDIADYYEKSDRKYDAEVALLFLNKAKQRMQLRTKYNRMGRIESSVKEYVRWARKYTEAVTEDGAWNRGELPQEAPELWFARIMELAFDVADMAEYGKLLKEALSYCPVFLPEVKALLAEKEMQTLAAQVKEAAQAQFTAGKPEEAQAMLAELVTMVPWDGETVELLHSLAGEDGEQQTVSDAEKTGKKRKEVVFLPYKASMWDSLESVWKAAAADPECDAYVVPIPYYDKNPDGSFKQIHYEGDQYPADVPVLWYEDYDLAARKPDVIFIHNPYDECNYVTSVEPAFYSKNLRKYTDKLVYIPYFVLGEIDPEDEEAVERMAHFCTLPGIVHAHKVIVQSENMRQAYIKVMTKFAGAHTKAIWEEKILGTGSPKLDKVSSVTRDDIAVPEEWQPILTKPDGARKKVILYNTSVSALLEQGEAMLKKMRDAFRVFRENREEIALLWRPHPLVQATIESMRPQMWEEYRALVEDYKTEGFGIYDDTADLNRAIALCDAYYGDGSSLVQLCRKAGKPVMIQNVEMVEE